MFFRSSLDVALCVVILSAALVGTHAREGRSKFSRESREGERRSTYGVINGAASNMPCFRADADGTVTVNSPCADGFECVDDSGRSRSSGVTKYCRPSACNSDVECGEGNTCSRGHCTVSADSAVFATACMIADSNGNTVSERPCPSYHQCDRSVSTSVTRDGQSMTAYKCRRGQ